MKTRVTRKFGLVSLVLLIVGVVGAPRVCFGADAAADPYATAEQAAQNPGVYTASESAPDLLTTCGNVKVTWADAAPVRPYDQGKVEWTATDGGTVTFEWRSTGWGCFYTAEGS